MYLNLIGDSFPGTTHSINMFLKDWVTFKPRLVAPLFRWLRAAREELNYNCWKLNHTCFQDWENDKMSEFAMTLKKIKLFSIFSWRKILKLKISVHERTQMKYVGLLLLLMYEVNRGITNISPLNRFMRSLLVNSFYWPKKSPYEEELRFPLWATEQGWSQPLILYNWFLAKRQSFEFIENAIQIRLFRIGVHVLGIRGRGRERGRKRGEGGRKWERK